MKKIPFESLIHKFAKALIVKKIKEEKGRQLVKTYFEDEKTEIVGYHVYSLSKQEEYTITYRLVYP